MPWDPHPEQYADTCYYGEKTGDIKESGMIEHIHALKKENMAGLSTERCSKYNR
jgi:hypothetical protein